VNTFFEREGTRGLVLVDDPQLPNRWYGGNKSFLSSFALGAFDYLDLDGLIRHLRTIEWTFPEKIQLIVTDEDHIRCHIINIFDELEPQDPDWSH
jgi:hypothetical protein